VAGREWDYVKECLDTGWVSSVGPFVDRFEQHVAEQIGVRFAVATASGTSALHLALLISGIRPGDEVLVPTLTFIASVNAIRYAGAHPVFCDSEPTYWQMDTDKLADFLNRECLRIDGELRNRSTGRPVKAILPVHVLGHPVDFDPIRSLGEEYGLAVIEDAAEGIGAAYKGRALGGLGSIACLSFNGNKIITTGGGGMVVTNNPAWAARARYLSTQAKDDPIEYIHNEIGYNYRLTNVLAAIGVAQLQQLPGHVEAKRRIAQSYTAAFGDEPGLTPMIEAPWAFSTYWMFTVLVDEKQFGCDSRTLLRKLAERRIQTRPLWQPIHQSKAHTGQAYRIEVADRLYRDAISLPCSVGLSADEQARVVAAIRASRG
jgi:perosamine synthetase